MVYFIPRFVDSENLCSAGDKSTESKRARLFSALFLPARSVFGRTALGIGERIVILLFVHAKLGLHSGFLVKHFADRGRLVTAMFLIGQGLEGPVEGEGESYGNGRGFLVSHGADRVIAIMTGQGNSILTTV